MSIRGTAQAAKAASIKLAAVESEVKQKALKSIAEALQADCEAIVAANREDLRISQENNLAPPLLERLKFDENKIAEVIAGIESLLGLSDPVGETLAAIEMDAGLELYKVSCPIGVVGVIFESRPDALVQISTLCLKSGNAVLLKGGTEATNTNRILASVIGEATRRAGIPDGWLRPPGGPVFPTAGSSCWKHAKTSMTC